eukprot:354173-Chlamydomonas_euryale.AAC.4
MASRVLSNTARRSLALRRARECGEPSLHVKQCCSATPSHPRPSTCVLWRRAVKKLAWDLHKPPPFFQTAVAPTPQLTGHRSGLIQAASPRWCVCRFEPQGLPSRHTCEPPSLVA